MSWSEHDLDRRHEFYEHRWIRDLEDPLHLGRAGARYNLLAIYLPFIQWMDRIEKADGIYSEQEELLWGVKVSVSGRNQKPTAGSSKNVGVSYSVFGLFPVWNIPLSRMVGKDGRISVPFPYSWRQNMYLFYIDPSARRSIISENLEIFCTQHFGKATPGRGGGFTPKKSDFDLLWLYQKVKPSAATRSLYEEVISRSSKKIKTTNTPEQRAKQRLDELLRFVDPNNCGQYPDHPLSKQGASK